MGAMKVNGIELEERGDMVVRASKDGLFEPMSFDVWRQYALPNTVCLDIGAYSGIYSIDAAARGCEVKAFEPNPNNVEMFKHNRETNLDPVASDRLRCYEKAASDVSGGMVPLRVKTGLPTTSASYIDTDALQGSKDWGVVMVETIRIDCIPLGDVSAMKIDVEGHELQVLAGAKRTITRDRPAIILESLSDEHEQQITEFLAQFNYGLAQRMDGRNLLFLG
jgi:FkbM family methyltransferase